MGPTSDYGLKNAVFSEERVFQDRNWKIFRELTQTLWLQQKELDRST